MGPIATPRGARRGRTSGVAEASGLARVRRLQAAQIAVLVVMALVMTALVLVAGGTLLNATERQREANAFLRELVELREEARLLQVSYWQSVQEGEARVTPEMGARTVLLAGRFQVLADRQAADVSAGEAAATAARRSTDTYARIVEGVREYAAATNDVEQGRIIGRAPDLVREAAEAHDAWVQARVEAANAATEDLDATVRGLASRAAIAIALLTLTGIAVWWALSRARIRVLAHLEASRREQAALRRAAEVVAREEAPAEVFGALAREFVALTGAEAGCVVRVDGDRGAVLGAYVAREDLRAVLRTQPGHRVPPDDVVARAMAEARPVRAEGGRIGPDGVSAQLAAAGIRTAAAAPVVVAGVPWGALVVVARDPRLLPPGDEEGLEPFARLAGLAIANAEARRRLAERASTDPLTGLPNHGVFHERLRDQAALATRHGQPLSLAVIDLDHFKEINDLHGHPAGDRVLSAVAAALRSVAREGELLARVGGEEFVWIMPGTDLAGAAVAAERARAAIAGVEVPGTHTLSASVGVCEFVDAGSAGELFRLADAALLLAKAQGRDMTVRYEPGVLEQADGDHRLQRVERARTLAALRALARAVDARDAATQRHSERVADLTHRIARSMGWHDDRAMALREAALVHDVGKIGIADEVLRKAGRLTQEEFRQVAAHPDLGAAIVTEVLSPEQVAWVRHHHERLDGGGYPGRLSGTAIPEGARILAAADAWDAMTTDRPYRSALSPEAAMAECSRVAGTQLDRGVVAVMERLVAAGAIPDADALGAWVVSAGADAAY